MKYVVVSRTIGIGNVFRIHPSEAYSGIDGGIIEVVAIHDVPAMDSACLNYANIFIEAEVSSYDPDTERDDILQTAQGLMDEPWIEYKYTRYTSRVSTPTIGEPQYMPLSLS